MYHFICLLLWGALSLIRRNALPLCDQRIQSRNWILSRNSMDISLKLENDIYTWFHSWFPSCNSHSGEDSCSPRHNCDCWMLPTQGQMLTSNNKWQNYFPNIILKILFLPLQFSVRVFPLSLARRVKIEAERLSPRYWIFRGSSGHFVHLNHFWSVADIKFIGHKSPDSHTSHFGLFSIHVIFSSAK